MGVDGTLYRATMYVWCDVWVPPLWGLVAPRPPTLGGPEAPHPPTLGGSETFPPTPSCVPYRYTCEDIYYAREKWLMVVTLTNKNEKQQLTLENKNPKNKNK